MHHAWCIFYSTSVLLYNHEQGFDMKIKEKAIELRKKGHSIGEISKLVNISKSTASVWLRGVRISVDARKVLDAKFTKGQLASQKTHRIQTNKKLLIAATKAEEVVCDLEITQQYMKVLCSMLYWCEGSKSINDSDFAFTNSDPTMVKTFLQLLRSGFVIDEHKLRVHMHLHEYHAVVKQLDFWSKVTNIDRSQFTKAHISSNTSKHIREEYQGCIRIRYHDVILAREIQALARAFMSKVNKGAIS